MLAPVEEIVPAPAKVKAVAEVAIVSREATPVRVPPVVTFRPPDEVRAKVPVALPMATVPVPVVAMVTAEAPAVARLVAPLLDRVVKAPVEGVEAPMVVELIVPPVMVTPEEAKVLPVRVWVTVSEPVLVVKTPVAPMVIALVLAVPIWTRPLVVVPVPPCSTKLPPTDVIPVWLEPLRVKLEPVPEPTVESPGAKTKALLVPAAVVVMSLVWPPARVMTPAVERSKFVPSMATVAELLPSPVTPVEVRVVKAPEAAVVAPIWVALMPVAVVLKVEAPVPEVMVRALVP